MTQISSARLVSSGKDFQSFAEFASVIDSLVSAPEDFQDYFNMPDRYFFTLCKSEVKKPSVKKADWDRFLKDESSPFLRMLERTRRVPLWPYVQAHLLVCHDAARWTTAREAMIEDIGKKTKRPCGFLNLLIDQLCNDKPPPEPWLTMPVLLVQDVGYMVDLKLRLVAGGRGECYPSPAMSMMQVDETFDNGKNAAIDYVTNELEWPLNNRDICWEMSPRGTDWPPEIKGPSASAAMAMLLAKLLAPPKR